MAKLIIVCVIAMLAVASAAFTFDVEFKRPFGSTMEEEAMSCPTSTCLTSQADCTATSGNVNTCIQTEFKNTSTVGSTTSCNCRSVGQWPSIGTTCSSGSTQTNQCGPYATCAVTTGGGAADWKCYGKKMIGDSCAVGSYECAAPRACSSAGVCVATLTAGAVCYNATTYKSLGMCPMTQYCPTGFTANQVCTDLLAAGAACSTGKCVPYTVCGLTSSASAPTCDRWVFGTLAAGVAYQANLQELSCASYLANYTSGNCVDYDAELAKWNTAFPSPSTIACSTSADCNLNGVDLASCVCTAKATGSTPYCLLGAKPSIQYASTIAIYKQSGIAETGYGAGCENPTPSGPEFVNNAAYCSSKWSSTLLAAACPSITASAASAYTCFDTSLGLCNGASALQSSVVMTMIVALVAFFTTQ